MEIVCDDLKHRLVQVVTRTYCLLLQEHEVFPLPNSTVLTEVGAANGVVFAMGSLYTSICPPLVLAGVGCAFLVFGFVCS